MKAMVKMKKSSVLHKRCLSIMMIPTHQALQKNHLFGKGGKGCLHHLIPQKHM
jgi:septum formation inhibitor-activating ATPase MinD